MTYVGLKESLTCFNFENLTKSRHINLHVSTDRGNEVELYRCKTGMV
jgi:hypothetical protein